MNDRDQARVAACEAEASLESESAQVTLSPELEALMKASCRLDELLAEAWGEAVAKLATETDRLIMGDSIEQEGT